MERLIPLLWQLPLLIAVLPVIGEGRAAEGPKAVGPANAAYRIELANAVPGQKTLAVYAVFEGGVGKRAFALAKACNAVAHVGRRLLAPAAREERNAISRRHT